MFTFNLLNLMQKSTRLNELESILNTNESNTPTPYEIKKSLQELNRCCKCHFIIFDDYWTDEIDRSYQKLCPTCGSNL